MGKRDTYYPHTISFRLTNETWLGIQKKYAIQRGQWTISMLSKTRKNI
jgi:hypothetical protein